MKIRTDLVRHTRVLPPAEAAAWQSSASQALTLKLRDFEITDALRLALGEYAPLEGFLTEADYRTVTQRSSLADGTPWDLPVVLAVSDDQRAELARGQLVALADRNGTLIGRIEIRSIYRGNSGRWLVGGPVDVLPSALGRPAGRATRGFKERLIDYASALGAVAG